VIIRAACTNVVHSMSRRKRKESSEDYPIHGSIVGVQLLLTDDGGHQILEDTWVNLVVIPVLVVWGKFISLDLFKVSEELHVGFHERAATCKDRLATRIQER
jgi:hypothetical protein